MCVCWRTNTRFVRQLLTFVQPLWLFSLFGFWTIVQTILPKELGNEFALLNCRRSDITESGEPRSAHYHISWVLITLTPPLSFPLLLSISVVGPL